MRSQLNPPGILFIALAAGLFVGAMPARSHRWAAESQTTASQTIQIYASAEDNALPIGILAPGEAVTPIAETHGAGGIKWYLVKSRSGTLGWIKQDTSEQSKKADDFFRSLPREASGIAVQIPTHSASSAAKNAIVVPIALSSGAIIVPVTFNGTVTANLLLDTGASMTMISHRLANHLALPAIASGLFSGIGGTISAQIARIESIKVGDAEVGGMPVSIHDLSRFRRFEGLLGMDFLGRFHLSLDPAKKVLMLTPK